MMTKVYIWSIVFFSNNCINLVPICNKQEFAAKKETQYVKTAKKENKSDVYIGKNYACIATNKSLIIATLNAIKVSKKWETKIYWNKKTMLTVSEGWRMGCVTGACTNQTTRNENWADIWILWVVVVVVIVV